MAWEVRKHFFFVKKEQKTFVHDGGGLKRATLNAQKFFGSFFQKRTSLFFEHVGARRGRKRLQSAYSPIFISAPFRLAAWNWCQNKIDAVSNHIAFSPPAQAS